MLLRNEQKKKNYQKIAQFYKRNKMELRETLSILKNFKQFEQESVEKPNFAKFLKN